MKKSLLEVNIETPISVTPDQILDAERIENDPEKMLQLIDLIFLCSDQERILS